MKMHTTQSPWSTALPLFVGLLVGCGSTPRVEDSPLEYAYLQHGLGVQWVDAERMWTAPGTAGAETFAWGRDGDGFLITRGGALEKISATGMSTLLLDGYLSLRFPSVSAVDGAVVVAATRESTTKGPWHVLLLPAGGGPVEDLGPGYDPCFLGSGRAIVFEDYDSEGSALHLLDLDTRTRRQLARGYTPSISADGLSVYYSSAGQLWSVPLDDPAAAPTALTSAGAYDRFASPSADGKTMLFFRQAEGVDRLVARDLRSGAERILTSGRVALPSYRPNRLQR